MGIFLILEKVKTIINTSEKKSFVSLASRHGESTGCPSPPCGEQLLLHVTACDFKSFTLIVSLFTPWRQMWREKSQLLVRGSKKWPKFDHGTAYQGESDIKLGA